MSESVGETTIDNHLQMMQLKRLVMVVRSQKFGGEMNKKRVHHHHIIMELNG